MEPIRYKPGEAIRWLETGADDLRRQAKRQTAGVVERTGDRNFGTDIRDVAGALIGFGKGALADILHRQAEASEYLVFPDRLEVVSPSGIRYIPFADMVSMKQKGDRMQITLKHGGLTIKPHAYIVAGRLRVPIGWSRNGIEVPFETLLDELSARADLVIEHI